jgi:hypothetical protein
MMKGERLRVLEELMASNLKHTGVCIFLLVAAEHIEDREVNGLRTGLTDSKI